MPGKSCKLPVSGAPDVPRVSMGGVSQHRQVIVIVAVLCLLGCAGRVEAHTLSSEQRVMGGGAAAASTTGPESPHADKLGDHIGDKATKTTTTTPTSTSTSNANTNRDTKVAVEIDAATAKSASITESPRSARAPVVTGETTGCDDEDADSTGEEAYVVDPATHFPVGCGNARKSGGPRTPFRILSIDGGGIRGIIPAQVLIELEGKLRNATGNPEAAISDYFDLVAGTSTGGIMALTLLLPSPHNMSRPAYDAQDTLQIYQDNADTIFHQYPRTIWGWIQNKWRSLRSFFTPKYSPQGIDSVLTKYAGNARMSQLLKPALITSFDMNDGHPFFFRSTNHGDHYVRDDYTVHAAGRATSAAPTYFPPTAVRSSKGRHHTLIDGGTTANNPAMCAVAEAYSICPSLNRLNKNGVSILSLGTGSFDLGWKYKDAKSWGKISWLSPLLSIMGASGGEVVHEQLTRLAMDKEFGTYFRVQADLSKEPDSATLGVMDNTTPHNVQRLTEVGAKLAQSANVQASLDDVIQELIR